MIDRVGLLVAALLVAAPVEATIQQGGSVYLVYAGPYSSSPASAFGHLFLAVPEYEGQPLTGWRVITFGADSGDAGPVTYLIDGIFGGFDGDFDEVSFHEKTRQYGVIDDRPTWAVEIQLTADEWSLLEEALAERREERRPYTFFELNCAFYLQELLAEVLEEVPAPQGITSPTGVIASVLESGRGEQTLYRPAESERIRESISDLGPSTRRVLLTRGWRESLSDTSWIAQLPDSDIAAVHQALAYHTKTARRALSQPETRGLESLRSRRVWADVGEAKAVPEGFGEPVPGLPFHGYTRTRVSAASESGRARMGLQFRPAMHDPTDPAFGHRGLNRLEILSLSLSTPADRLDPRLDRLVVFSQRSLTPSDWVRPVSSWSLELLAQRGGLFSADGLHFELRSGGGRTIQVGSGFYAFGLLGGAVILDSQGSAAVAPGIETGMAWAPQRGRVRLGVTALGEVDVSRINRRSLRGHAWAGVELTSQLGLTVVGRWGDQLNSWAVGFDLYH